MSAENEDGSSGHSGAAASLESVIVAPTRELGDGFEVRRALPSARRRMVGPFIFFDQMGPAVFGSGRGLDVRPHPHIGLATVTYLFEGEILHRDSLGVVQSIRPGEVNWMTAGSGIVHSERTPASLRQTGGRLFGIQVWVALPKAHEETSPTFAHHDAESLPLLEAEGARVRLIVGSSFGRRSPVQTFSEMVYADLELAPKARFAIPAEHEERALYVTEGEIEIDSIAYPTGQVLVLRPGKQVTIAAGDRPCRLMFFGGESADAPRRIFWNFVSSSQDRIEQAKEDWRAGRFPQVPEEHEFIPLPEGEPSPVRYP